MSQAGSLAKCVQVSTPQVANAELANQLRAAAVDGDDARIARLVSELLRCKGLSRSQRIALQQRALLSLVQSLRSAALNDDLTGLNNRRGFVQVGTRVLDFAVRDTRTAHLVYFCVDHLERVCETHGRDAGQILIRDCGNLLRDLFPNYGVHEVLGRMANDEFAALTMRPEFSSRDRVVSGIQGVLATRSSSLALSIGVAHFDPRKPQAIDELLAAARCNVDQAFVESGSGLPISRFGPSALTAYRV
jgi:diguanylate cyclase (GGDEF)-like protein